MDGITKAKDRGAKFGRRRELTDEKAKEIRTLRESGDTVSAIIKRTGFSKASVYLISKWLKLLHGHDMIYDAETFGAL
ncbi:MAG: helix-turn-helix domain-containing protein, partial [Methyloceanibacter sp.]